MVRGGREEIKKKIMVYNRIKDGFELGVDKVGFGR